MAVRRRHVRQNKEVISCVLGLSRMWKDGRHAADDDTADGCLLWRRAVFVFRVWSGVPCPLWTHPDISLTCLVPTNVQR